MGKYAIRRALLFIPTLLVATILVFTLFWIVPGDPALTILAGGEGDSGAVSPEQLQQLRQTLGLDRPIYVKYASWLTNVLRGDLGTSLWYKTPVWNQLKGIREPARVLHEDRPVEAERLSQLLELFWRDRTAVAFAAGQNRQGGIAGDDPE